MMIDVVSFFLSSSIFKIISLLFFFLTFLTNSSLYTNNGLVILFSNGNKIVYIHSCRLSVELKLFYIPMNILIINL